MISISDEPCRGRDSNPYALASTAPSKQRVYLFHHLGMGSDGRFYAAAFWSKAHESHSSENSAGKHPADQHRGQPGDARRSDDKCGDNSREWHSAAGTGEPVGTSLCAGSIGEPTQGRLQREAQLTVALDQGSN